MKFIIVKTDLFINNKLYPEGSEIDLTKEQSKGIEEFLQPCHSEPASSGEETQKKLNTKGNKK